MRLHITMHSAQWNVRNERLYSEQRGNRKVKDSSRIFFWNIV